MAAANLLTDWRKALQLHLRTNLQDGRWTVKAGERDGPVTDARLAVVFPPAKPLPLAPDIEFTRPVMIIRAWIPRSTKEPRNPDPMDPGPLEQLAIDLETCLQPVQSSLLVGRIVFWIADIEIDKDDWGIQATLTGWAINQGTIGSDL